MGGCCLVVLLLLISPRLFLVGVWLLSNWYIAFDSRLVAFLGWLFLPYTSLAWMYIFFHNGGQIEGGSLGSSGELVYPYPWGWMTRLHFGSCLERRRRWVMGRKAALV
ncbi:MAG: hypothetical protein ACYC3X_30790, partial [Pirellulaceae bacterium]